MKTHKLPQAGTLFGLYFLVLFLSGCTETEPHVTERVVHQTETVTIEKQVIVEKMIPPGAIDPSHISKQDRMQPDLLGPDGQLYHNFTWAGLPDDLERPTRIFNVQDYSKIGGLRGKVVNDALNAAIKDAAKAGGGIVQFDSGIFFLDRPVFIPHSNIIIRGLDRGARWKTTQLVFTYRPPESGVEVLYPSDGDRMHPEGGILVVAEPGLYPEHYTEGPDHQILSKDTSQQLTNIGIQIDGTDLFKQDKSTRNNNQGAPQCYLTPYISHLWNANLQDGDRAMMPEPTFLAHLL